MFHQGDRKFSRVEAFAVFASPTFIKYIRPLLFSLKLVTCSIERVGRMDYMWNKEGEKVSDLPVEINPRNMVASVFNSMRELELFHNIHSYRYYSTCFEEMAQRHCGIIPIRSTKF